MGQLNRAVPWKGRSACPQTIHHIIHIVYLDIDLIIHIHIYIDRGLNYAHFVISSCGCSWRLD
jgi:hypothetical protein